MVNGLYKKKPDGVTLTPLIQLAMLALSLATITTIKISQTV